jgi:hypothetical protein
MDWDITKPDGVFTQEPANRRIVPTGVVVLEARGTVKKLAGVADCQLWPFCGPGSLRYRRGTCKFRRQ